MRKASHKPGRLWRSHSSAGSATTRRWGEIDGNGILNALDITAVVNRFKNAPGAVPFEQANVWPCAPDGVIGAVIDALDIVSAVDAFKGLAFSCAIVCP